MVVCPKLRGIHWFCAKYNCWRIGWAVSNGIINNQAPAKVDKSFQWISTTQTCKLFNGWCFPPIDTCVNKEVWWSCVTRTSAGLHANTKDSCFHLTCYKVSLYESIFRNVLTAIFVEEVIPRGVELCVHANVFFCLVKSIRPLIMWLKSMLYLCYRCSPQSSNNSPSRNSNITGDCNSSRGELRRSHLIIPARLKVQETGARFSQVPKLIGPEKPFFFILGDPGTVSRVDKMSVVKVGH